LTLRWLFKLEHGEHGEGTENTEKASENVCSCPRCRCWHANQEWKGKYGNEAWALLEKYSGKLA